MAAVACSVPSSRHCASAVACCHAAASTALQSGFEDAKAGLAERVTAIADRYPLYAQLGEKLKTQFGGWLTQEEASGKTVYPPRGQRLRASRR